MFYDDHSSYNQTRTLNNQQKPSNNQNLGTRELRNADLWITPTF